jgi:hypothetical protein
MEKEEMCDCGEPDCTFTKEEAREFTDMIKEYREALFSDKKDTELNDMQLHVRKNMKFVRPPWMESEEWNRLLEKNKADGFFPHSMEDQIFSQFSDIIESRK